MGSKPTYEELEKRVKKLEEEINELKRVGNAVKKKESRLREAEQIALLGHWE